MIDYNKRGAVEYGISVEAVLWRTRIPQYIYCAKSLYGDSAELVIEDLLHQGQSLMSRLVDAVTNKLNEALESTGQYPYRAVPLYTQTKKKRLIFMVLYLLIQLRCCNKNKTKMLIKRLTHKKW